LGREKGAEGKREERGISLTLLPFQALYTSGASPAAPAPVPTPALALAPFIAAARSAANSRRDHGPDHYIAGAAQQPPEIAAPQVA
jgi:hypothetical protein